MNPNAIQVTLIEDDPILADALTTQLQRQGYNAVAINRGDTALEHLLQSGHLIDVVILDLGLPGMNGLDVLRRCRAQGIHTPILILTALDGLEDRIAGLNAGADDYLCKPFDFPELHARMQAILRRSSQRTEKWQMGELTIDLTAHRMSLNHVDLELSPREWSLLLLLAQHRDAVVRKEDIYQVWDDNPEGGADPSATNVLEVYIHRLRRKLEDSSLRIRTVRGLGYLLQCASPA